MFLLCGVTEQRSEMAMCQESQRHLSWTAGEILLPLKSDCVKFYLNLGENFFFVLSANGALGQAY